MRKEQVQVDVARIIGEKEIEIQALRRHISELEEVIAQLTPSEPPTSEPVQGDDS